jgi:NTE family protein
MLSRASSMMIRQNSLLMTQLMHPDVLVDIQMSNYGSFDYDKSEKIVAIGRKKTQQALSKI